MARTRVQKAASPAPASAWRPRSRDPRHPQGFDRTVLEPTLQEDTHPLGPRAAAGALFPPAPEPTSVTLPRERPSGRSHAHRASLAAAERQFLCALFVALGLAAGALLLAGVFPALGSVSREDAGLAAAAVASGVLMLVLGHFCRRTRP